MRKVIIVLSFVPFLLMAGCHRRDKKEVRPESVPQCEEVTEQEDTASVETDSLVKSSKKLTVSDPYQLQLDSAEITNLRLMGRKQRVIYRSRQLWGKWHRGSEHVVFNKDSTGLMWDLSDDVLRKEAQHFKWRLDSNLLLLVFKMERGAFLPMMYLVTFADDESLAYSDAYGNAFLWDRDTTVRVAFADGFLSKKDSLSPIVSAHGKHHGHQGCMLFP
ncbi:MAG: hypothetical protein IKP89_05810 [Bacteroidales bacterium]|nr:hypothetical protein [Bacteroidales bacterium]